MEGSVDGSINGAPPRLSAVEIKALQKDELNKSLANGDIDVTMIRPYLQHPDVDLNNALQQRAKRGDFLVIQAILDHIRIDSIEASMISWRGRPDEVERLIDNNGLLTRATQSGNLELVKYLVINGASLNSGLGGWPYSPPNYAVTSGHFDIVKYYVEELGVRNREWQGAAVQLAMSFPTTDDLRTIRILQYLISKGLITINGRNSNGATLLHGATKYFQLSLMKYLLKLKANPFIRDRTGKMAWDLSSLPHKMDWDLTPLPRDVFYNFDKENFKIEDLWFVYYNNLFDIKAVPKNWSSLFWEHGGLERRISSRLKYQTPDDVKLWIRLPGNNDARFNMAISALSAFEGYDDDAIAKVMRFIARTFLEQDAQDPRLKFREPSYNTFFEEVGWEEKHHEDHPLEHAKTDDSQNVITKEKPADKDVTIPLARMILQNKKKIDITSIVVPYFDSRLKDQLTDSRRKVNRTDEQKLADEMKVSMNVHESRTLDESYYLGLDEKQLSSRNEDQVISRVSKHERKKQSILMVSQLWLWKMDNIIITALPSRELDPAHSLVSEIKEGNIRPPQDLTSLQMTALIFSECINFLDRPRSAGLEEPIFYTFDKAIAIAFDHVQTYMKELRPENTRIDKEKDFIHQMSDIRDEIVMIRNIIDQQEEVWGLFYRDLKDQMNHWDANLVRIITRPNEQLPKFKLRIQKIDENAERVERWILVQLDLKSKHAGLKESQNSTTLGTSVIGFTVITVIFTPLSFISSLFALPIDKLQQKQHSTADGNTFYTSGYIGKWMTVGEVVSLFVTGVLIWLSFVWLRRRQDDFAIEGIGGAEDDETEAKRKPISHSSPSWISQIGGGSKSTGNGVKTTEYDDPCDKTTNIIPQQERPKAPWTNVVVARRLFRTISGRGEKTVDPER